MKNEKLLDAIGMVGDDLIVGAKQVKRKRKKHTFMAIAAILALVLVITSIYQATRNSVRLYANVIAEADYPKMAEFPNASIFHDIYFDKREKWADDQKKQNADYVGMTVDYDEFFKKSISEFLKGSGKENKVFSPLNVYMALGMLAEVTDGNSREQILKALNVDSIERLRKEANAIWNANYSDDGKTVSILASSIWLDKDIDYKKETLKSVAENYYASSFSGEMGSEKYNKALRTWLNSQTGNMLKGHVDNLKMNPETVMTLATTLRFSAKWEDEFSSSNNTKDIFHGASGDEKCEFMNDTETYGCYYWGEKFSATNKDFKYSGDGSYSMWFVLPDEGVSMDELLVDEQALNFMSFPSDWEDRKSVKVNMTIPKFDVESQYDLKEGLNNMGITDVFDDKVSNFSPMTEDEMSIYIDSVLHGGRVLIDEEGCEAAFYTIMQGVGSSMPPENEVDFIVDRPFIFIITSDVGMPLFMGVVNNLM